MIALRDAFLANAVLAALLAMVAIIIEWRSRRPELIHAVWSIVLARLVVPPLVVFAVLPPVPIDRIVTGGHTAATTTRVPAPADAAVIGIPTIGQLAVTIWIAGAVALLLIATIRIARLRRRLTRAESAGAKIAATVGDLARRIGVRGAIRIVLVDEAVPPMIWGSVFSKTLILPRALMDRLGGVQREALILHELAHLRRHDHWIRHLELVATSIFWWHPIAWLARRRLRIAEEECCDAIVARTLPDSAQAYASCLIDTAQFVVRAGLSTPALASGVLSSHHLERRLRMILSNRIHKPYGLATRLLVALVAIVPIAVTPMFARPESHPEVRVVSTADPDYQGERIDLDLEGASLHQTIDIIASQAGLHVAWAADTPDVLVWARYEQIPWDQVMNDLITSNGFDWKVDGNVVSVMPPANGVSTRFSGEPIDLELQRAPLASALRSIPALRNVTLDIAPDIDLVLITHFRQVPWDRVLDEIMSANGLGYELKNGTLRVWKEPNHDDVAGIAKR